MRLSEACANRPSLPPRLSSKRANQRRRTKKRRRRRRRKTKNTKSHSAHLVLCDLLVRDRRIADCVKLCKKTKQKKKISLRAEHLRVPPFGRSCSSAARGSSAKSVPALASSARSRDATSSSTYSAGGGTFVRMHVAVYFIAQVLQDSPTVQERVASQGERLEILSMNLRDIIKSITVLRSTANGTRAHRPSTRC